MCSHLGWRHRLHEYIYYGAFSCIKEKESFFPWNFPWVCHQVFVFCICKRPGLKRKKTLSWQKEKKNRKEKKKKKKRNAQNKEHLLPKFRRHHATLFAIFLYNKNIISFIEMLKISKISKIKRQLWKRKVKNISVYSWIFNISWHGIFKIK
jgi:hypothetical protein